MAKPKKIGFKIESRNVKEVALTLVEETRDIKPKCFGDFDSKICNVEYFCGEKCALQCQQEKEKLNERRHS